MPMFTPLLYICGLVFICSSVQINFSPQSISNAPLGGTARFNCILSSETAYPAWNINGKDYLVTDLPLGYMYTFSSDSYSNELIVGPLNMAMNNSCYYCYVINYQGRRQESAQAKLTIIQTHIMDTYSTTIRDFLIISSVVTHVHETLVPTLSSSQQPAPTHFLDGSANDSLTYYAVASAGAALVVVSASFFIVVTATWLYCHQRSKGVHVMKGNKDPVYEDVHLVIANQHSHLNPTYETPSTIGLRENPAYDIINKLSLSRSGERLTS